VQETITVTGDSPIVDAKATGTSTNFTQAELEKVPTSRDPWALLRTVPGVMVDRVNIAGNETGQQSNFQSKGTRPADAVWTMDGVVITDMAAIGASPTYFNYDNFEEIQISTSGQDIRQQTGGVGLNFVVKRGTNQFKGLARGFYTNDALEGSNVPDEMAALGVTSETSDHNEQISDYGFELGGPIVKERAWIYGSFSTQDIRLVRSAGNVIDRTILDTWNVKGNVQATSKDMVSVLWFLGAKEKSGRSPGVAGITHQADSTWFQGGSYVDGRPHGLVKIEDNRVMSSSFYVTGRYAYYNTGFGLDPAGGMDQNAGLSQRLGTSFGSYQQSLNVRPQHTVNVDTNYFTPSWGDIKLGGGWRRSDAFTGTLWPGNMILAFDNSATSQVARVYRQGAGTNRVEFFYLYAGDTITKDRLTIDLGVRYDRQWGAALPSQARGNTGLPTVVPGIDFTGYDAPFTWNNFSPRAGVTYALDEARKTILRASFSRYAGQLDTGTVGYMNPSSTAGYADYGWNDLNDDHLAQENEVLLSQFIGPGGGFNPANPTAVTSANRIDPDLEAPVTTSVVAGIDRELMPNLAVQANYSFTQTSNFASSTTFTPWIGSTGSDYSPGALVTGTLPDGTPY
ncbi:MAG: TonB-dependent receptor plug domain-containing protein, partial [Vicinamibacterales bacterium]